MGVLHRGLDELVARLLVRVIPAQLLCLATGKTDAGATRIGSIVGMALRALRFRPHMRAEVRRITVDGGPCESYVRGVGDELHVGGVHAPLRLADMVDRKPGWDRPMLSFVVDTVYPTPLCFPEAHAAVPVLMHGTIPKPASVVVNRVAVI